MKASRDFDRKRISEEILEKVLKEEYFSLKNLQKGFEYYSPGLFYSQDLMHPFVELIPNCVEGGLIRFFETNTFWKKLECHGAFNVEEESIFSWIQKYYCPCGIYENHAPIVFTIPFLFLFRRFSEGFSFENIQMLLEKVIRVIDNNFKGLLVFFEPFLGWEKLDHNEMQMAYAFLEKMKSITSIPLALIQCFGSVEKEGDAFYSLPVDWIGIDFYRNPLSEVEKKFPKDKALLAGVFSMETTALEKKEHLEAFLNRVKNFLPLNKIALTTSGPAELLPKTILDNKICHAKEILRCF